MTLNDYNIIAERKDGMTGVWVNDEKICAMGVRISNGKQPYSSKILVYHHGVYFYGPSLGNRDTLQDRGRATPSENQVPAIVTP